MNILLFVYFKTILLILSISFSIANYNDYIIVENKIIISDNLLFFIGKDLCAGKSKCIQNYAKYDNSFKYIAQFSIGFNYTIDTFDTLSNLEKKYSSCVLNPESFNNITKYFLEKVYNNIKCEIYNIQEGNACNFILQYRNYFYAPRLYVDAICLNKKTCKIYNQLINEYTYECFQKIDNISYKSNREELICGLIMLLFILLMLSTCARENYVYGAAHSFHR